MQTKNKIVSRQDLNTQVNAWKADGASIVFSNGCFDILHVGHLEYLEKAREKGDKLIIGLNTDASVKRLKGENRPINDETFRAKMLAALAFVDAVVFFEEDTPLNLINTLKPDFLVKGDDYTVEQIVGAEEVLAYGGQVATIELVEGFSTTVLIDRIKKS